MVSQKQRKLIKTEHPELFVKSEAPKKPKKERFAISFRPIKKTRKFTVTGIRDDLNHNNVHELIGNLEKLLLKDEKLNELKDEKLNDDVVVDKLAANIGKLDL